MLERAYLNFIDNSGFEIDQAQLELIKILEKFKRGLEKRNRPLLNLIGIKSSETMFGVYIHGDVGRGKSMIMDLFYNQVNTLKQKVHFHDFMFKFHSDLNQLQASNSNVDHIKSVAQNISKKAKLLCLDELQINNIADAMIVERLFKALIKENVFIIITSNRKPSELFINGLQRERFLPFINIVQKNMVIYALDNHQDYRLKMISSLEKTYFFPINNESIKTIDHITSQLMGEHKFEHKDIEINSNRTLHIANCFGNIAVFTFDELCISPKGVADYTAICKNFHTIIVKNTPQMGNDQDNETTRFITLIDCLYDKKINVIISANTDIENLYIGNRYKFEFKRTISRLHEMQSKEYISSSSY